MKNLLNQIMFKEMLNDKRRTIQNFNPFLAQFVSTAKKFVILVLISFSI